MEFRKFPRIVLKYSREESIQGGKVLFSCFFACDVIQVIQVKQIDFCCIRLLQLGNIAKNIISICLLKHFEQFQFQEHYKMANKSLFCFPLIQVRKLFKGGNYSREETIKYLEVLTAETIQIYAVLEMDMNLR